MVVTLAGMVIEVSSLQPEKALAAMAVTLYVTSSLVTVDGITRSPVGAVAPLATDTVSSSAEVMVYPKPSTSKS